MNECFVGQPGRWVLRRDNDGHDYLIPEEHAARFREWVEFMESDSGEPEWDGVDYDQYRCGRHPSSYVLVGRIELEERG